MLVAVLSEVMAGTSIPLFPSLKTTKLLSPVLYFTGEYVWDTPQTLQFPGAFNSVRVLL